MHVKSAMMVNILSNMIQQNVSGKDDCSNKSSKYSLLIFFGISFLYWVVMIFFIFILLHFRFDIKTGYAYGIIFYYCNSVLQHIVLVFNEIV